MKHLILLKACWSVRLGMLPPPSWFQGSDLLHGWRAFMLRVGCVETQTSGPGAFFLFFCVVLRFSEHPPTPFLLFFYKQELRLRLDYSPDNNNTKQEAWKSLHTGQDSVTTRLSGNLAYCFRLSTRPADLLSEFGRVTVQNRRVPLPVRWDASPLPMLPQSVRWVILLMESALKSGAFTRWAPRMESFHHFLSFPVYVVCFDSWLRLKTLHLCAVTKCLQPQFAFETCPNMDTLYTFILRFCIFSSWFTWIET